LTAQLKKSDTASLTTSLRKKQLKPKRLFLNHPRVTTTTLQPNERNVLTRLLHGWRRTLNLVLNYVVWGRHLPLVHSPQALTEAQNQRLSHGQRLKTTCRQSRKAQGPIWLTASKHQWWQASLGWQSCPASICSRNQCRRMVTVRPEDSHLLSTSLLAAIPIGTNSAHLDYHSKNIPKHHLQGMDNLWQMVGICA
jgi:hypothetical protein